MPHGCRKKPACIPPWPDPAKDAAEASPTEGDGAQEEDMFPPEMRAQLETVFQKMEAPLLLEMSLDDRPVSAELEQFLTTLTGLTDKLTLRQAASPKPDAPCVRILRADGEDTGIAFHGVPGGHEFTSFVLALYNAAGPGQSLPRRGRGSHPRHPAARTDAGFRVALVHHVPPELVAAAQRIASLNPLVSAEAYDPQPFPVPAGSVRGHERTLPDHRQAASPYSAKKISSSCWISSKNMHKYPSGDRKPVLFLSLRGELSTGARPFLWKKILDRSGYTLYTK